ncbi:uncharacterized protein FOMMEDRAFT_20509 [Fomitiporia mediterranea MF3/22]|uniref:uncharacterized protein n=1 Tax=Fomitiporia mediterranea (strain MF3/22) TaxID=694068 RepID=UPI0004408056|nr:uncharacterized protein FOMMEDRAFT_20509 [Fomitiporia mediterranea MF3/22]EJD03402.1 hypothetical protein FOMMEDRAFT_20509 [Fomitiporia mediterranea MF3/22]
MLASEAERRRALRTFLSVLAIVTSARSIQALFLRSRKKDEEKERTILDKTAVQIALFPTLIPRLYPYFRRQLGTSGLAELISSAFLLLIPPSWRVQAALYATSSALYHSGKTSRLRQWLPPTWTLNIIGNAILLWAFLFKSEAFPSVYERVILSNSTHYVPPEMTRTELEELLRNATFSRQSASTTPTSSTQPQSKHAYTLCAELHPSEPSCLKNYIKASLDESSRTWRWVGAFSVLPILLSKKNKEMLARDPMRVLWKWLTATVRGTAFVTGSITTAWATTCLLQRMLPRHKLKQARWMINASISSLWILILPSKRRNEIALYVARLAALCAWRIWRLEGGPAIPFGDIALFACSWMQLSRLQRRGEKITGLVGLGLSMVQPKT